MRAEKIRKKFQTYIDGLEDPTIFGTYSTSVAALFGSDQVELDPANNRLKLPEFDWVHLAAPVPSPKDLGWVAVIKEGDQYEIAFGRRGVSPFSEEAGEFLPKIDDVILAMPFLNSDRLKEKMIAT